MRVQGYQTGLLFLLAGVLSLPLPPLREAKGETPTAVETPQAMRSGPRQLKRVFREVVAEPRKSTVRLYADAKLVGLGTVVDADGWIVSKASQVKGATEAELFDGRRLALTTVGVHPQSDLLLARVAARNLSPVVWDLQSPEVGAWLVSASTREDPLSVGVVSLERRKIERSNVKGYLGVELELEEPDLARIRRVLPNSGASAAGLKQGDLVLEVNQQRISSAQHLVRTLGDYRPGDTLALRIRRSEEEIPCSVTLTHPFGELLSRIAFQNQLGGELSFRRDDFEAVYQHDSVLQPEECGGPALTLDGRAVGINIARAGRTASFALPADLILDVLEDMKSGKYPPSAAEAAVDKAGAHSDDRSGASVDEAGANSGEEAANGADS